MDSLNYNKYENNVISEYKGNDKLNKADSALANRPLMPIMPDWNTNKKQTTKPSAPQDVKESNVSKYNEKDSNMLPITIKPDANNNYAILENELINSDMDYNTNDKMVTNIPVINKKEKKEPTEYKMNFATQFYVGSLTVIGLFVFYRLIQKTR
jgi:capsular polysaccharide biosynthesis protein